MRRRNDEGIEDGSREDSGEDHGPRASMPTGGQGSGKERRHGWLEVEPLPGCHQQPCDDDGERGETAPAPEPIASATLDRLP